MSEEMFRIHTPASAAPAARETLEKVSKQFGFVPNLMGIMANSPPLMKAYLQLSQLLRETGFSPLEQQLLLLVVSVENRCAYCVAAHSASLKRAGASAEIIGPLRDGKPLTDAKLEALRRFATTVVRSRGFPDKVEIGAFLAAGYEPNRILDVILAVGLKTLSNYTNHIANTPLDSTFSAERWGKMP